MKTETGNYKAPDGTTLFTRAWLPDRPRGVIVLQHGLGEHTERYDYVGRFLTSYGYAVHAMDSRGHGKTGERHKDLGYFARLDTLVADLDGYIQSVFDLYPDSDIGKPFLIGHSMGGLVALVYAIRHQASLRGLVVSAPALDAGESIPGAMIQVVKVVGNILPRLGMVALDSGTLSRDPAVVAAYVADPLVWHGRVPARVASELIGGARFATANAGAITLPCLVMHGAADRLVNPKGTPAIFETITSADKTLKLWPGLYHEIFNEPEKDTVLAEVIGWVQRH